LNKNVTNNMPVTVYAWQDWNIAYAKKYWKHNIKSPHRITASVFVLVTRSL